MSRKTESSFATRMHMRREKRKENLEKSLRLENLENGALTAAWDFSYKATYAQMGKPTWEKSEGDDYWMVWHRPEDPTPSVVLNLGMAYKFMKSASRRSTIFSIMENHAAIVHAPRTIVSYVLTVPDKLFDKFAPLEQWTQANNLPVLRVIKAFNTDKVVMYVRSNGTGWFGQDAATQSVIVFEIP